MKISEVIRKRIKHARRGFFANDNISDFIRDDDLEQLQFEVQDKIEELLGALVIDTVNDHNTRETAARVAKMFLHEVYKGRYTPPPKITDFPNAKNLDELYTVGPVTIRSACSHHLVPIMGKAWIGVIPSHRVIGLSKFNRLTEWIMARPQIQEEATVQLADEIERLIQPKALAVVVKASHLCMTWRGVRESETSMTTSVMRGAFRDSDAARQEFFSIIKGQGYV